MRVYAIVLALAISEPAASAGPTPAPGPAIEPAAAVARPNFQIATDCPQTISHYAGKGSLYRRGPVNPKKLAELPAATGYMAVYRTVNGCEVPMTIVEYRTGRTP